MPLPIRLTLRGIEASDAIASYVQAKADKLPTFGDHILRCAVAVEAENRSARHGQRFRVRVDVTVPGHELVCDEHGADAYASIDAVFDHIARQLADLTRRRRHGAGSRATLREAE